MPAAIAGYAQGNKIIMMKNEKIVGEDYHDVHALTELVIRVYTDVHATDPADVAYLFGQSINNEDSVLTGAIFLWNAGRVKQLCISAESAPGFIRSAEWRARLIHAGVPETQIDALPHVSIFPRSTDAEAESIIERAEICGWKNIYLVSTPVHQLRAFISVVSALKRKKAELQVFNCVGSAQRWDESVMHSQGVQRGLRRDLVHKELEKIEHYFQKGDLIAPREVLAYLNKRDESDFPSTKNTPGNLVGL